MSKVFTKEGDLEADLEDPDPLPPGVQNLMTPTGVAMLRDELEHLLRKERPAVVEIVSWAASNGDRSENGDYIYNKKRLRQIDRRIRYLTKRLDDAQIVDPKDQQNLEQVFFGATVQYVRADGSERTVTLVGVDEANMEAGKINWQSPVGRALLKAHTGDVVEVRTDAGTETLEIVSVLYKLT